MGSSTSRAGSSIDAIAGHSEVNTVGALSLDFGEGTATTGTTGASGVLGFSSGSASSGNIGAMWLGTGAATDGRGGLISFTVGSSTSGVGSSIAAIAGGSEVNSFGFAVRGRPTVSHCHIFDLLPHHSCAAPADLLPHQLELTELYPLLHRFESLLLVVHALASPSNALGGGSAPTNPLRLTT